MYVTFRSDRPGVHQTPPAHAAGTPRCSTGTCTAAADQQAALGRRLAMAGRARGLVGGCAMLTHAHTFRMHTDIKQWTNAQTDKHTSQTRACIRRQRSNCFDLQVFGMKSVSDAILSGSDPYTTYHHQRTIAAFSSRDINPTPNKTLLASYLPEARFDDSPCSS